MEYIFIPEKNKVSKEKWLNYPIKYDKQLFIKDIVQEMAENTYSWIESKNDLDPITDYSTFENDFINLLYDKYYNE
tara:strand:+ start:846 stop:1073 length:228 start_codon:yes stop_codon:yes gene_type:complete